MIHDVRQLSDHRVQCGLDTFELDVALIASKSEFIVVLTTSTMDHMLLILGGSIFDVEVDTIQYLLVDDKAGLVRLRLLRREQLV